MTQALCLNCGSLKFGAWCPCPECQAGSTGEANLDILFSDHHFTPATLSALGEIIQQIKSACDDDAQRFRVFMKYFSDNYPEHLTIHLAEEIEDSVTEVLRSLHLPRLELELSERGLASARASAERGRGRSSRSPKRRDRALLRKLKQSHMGALGTSDWDPGAAEMAMKHHQEALAAARELGDRKAEGEYLGCLGNDLLAQGKVDQARQYYEEALAIARETGDRENEATCTGGIGNALFAPVKDLPAQPLGMGDLPQLLRVYRTVRRAMPLFVRAADIAREAGDRKGEGIWVGNLGSAYHCLGRMRRAIPCYERALVIAREVGDHANEAEWLRSLGKAYGALKEPERAVECQGRSLMVEDSGMDPGARAILLYHLGSRAQETGDLDLAREFWGRALTLSESAGIPIVGEIRRALAELPD
jgi:tetratricopeptide (TPR) repeat protein